MNTKTTTLFWLTAFAITLISIIFALSYNTTTNSPTNSPKTTVPTTYDQLTFLKSIFKKTGPITDNFLSLLSRSRRHHHHHYHRGERKAACDESKWKSKLISKYSVSLVITVDLKGCANFSSVQKAVDAVPNLSFARTLIIIDSGTYR